MIGVLVKLNIKEGAKKTLKKICSSLLRQRMQMNLESFTMVY